MATNINEKRDVDFNVKLSKTDKSMLEQLARDRGITMSSIIRENIELRFRQRFSNAPKCATGNACLCPNMHVLQPAETPSNEDLLAGLGVTDGEAA